MTFFFLLEGVGSVIFFVMGVTLFGNVYLPDRRAKALSYTMSAGWATALFGPTVNVLIANSIGWRWNFLLWVLPWMFVGLILSYFAVPKSSATTAVVEKVSIGGAFKSVLKNSSATAILAANILAIAGVEVGVFAIPFYRYPNGFNFSLTSALGWVTVVATIFVIFIVVGGRLVNRFGAKPMAVICTLLTGVFTMIFFFIPYLPLTLFFDSLHCIFAAMALPAYACLALAQVPKARGTMMALNQAMDNVGKMMAPFIGGLILSATLAVYDLEVYGFVGLMLGGLSVEHPQSSSYGQKTQPKPDCRLQM
jgi:predicted MFS family arabinose efflux permease